MPPRPPADPRKKPAQRRARVTVDALVEATARILAAEGPDAVNTNRIAEVAGVSVGSLYQYFPNKAALVAAVIERELERDLALASEMLRRLEPLPLPEALDAFALGFVAATRAKQPLHEHLLPLVDAVDRARLVREHVARVHDRFVAFLARRPDELRPELARDPVALERATFLAGRAAEAALNAAKVERPEILADPATPRLIAALIKAPLLPGDAQGC